MKYEVAIKDGANLVAYTSGNLEHIATTFPALGLRTTINGRNVVGLAFQLVYEDETIDETCTRWKASLERTTQA